MGGMEWLGNPSALMSLVFLIAALYASVGHGGASGYLAVLALASVDHRQAGTTALLLNLIVAGIAFVSYWRNGHFSWRLTFPFLITSIPFALLGGMIQVPRPVYAGLLALALSFAAIRMLFLRMEPRPSHSGAFPDPPSGVALLAGGLIGLLSGIVGVGGGIFLSPLILIAGWAEAKRTSATAACFILCNSLAGLLGRSLQGGGLDGSVWPLAVAGVAGGLIGGEYGARHAGNRTLCRLLALVLAVAVLKLVVKPH